MKNLKTFESWGSNYPAGAEYDSNAPWNQRDPEYVRGVDLKPEEIKFEVVNSDYSEIAVLKDKSTGDHYAIAFDSSDDDFRDYMAVDREYIGRDEDGDAEYEYDWGNAEVDDEAIEAFASDEAKYKGLGKGLDDFESNKLSLMDSDVAKEVISFYEYDINAMEKSGRNTHFYYKTKYENAKNAVEYLKAFLKEK